MFQTHLSDTVKIATINVDPAQGHLINSAQVVAIMVTVEQFTIECQALVYVNAHQDLKSQMVYAVFSVESIWLGLYQINATHNAPQILIQT